MKSNPPRYLAVLLLALTGCFSADPAQVVRGPLPTRNQHPVSLTFLHMRPRKAATQPKGKVGVALDAAYSSIFEVSQEPGERVAFDGETLRAAARFRYGVSNAVDVEVELAALYTTSGFLDSFIDEFHNATGLPDAGRLSSDRNQYEMRLRRNGQEIYNLEEDRVGFADLPIVVTGSLRKEDENGPGLALRGGIELPTGSEGRGYGNGEIDYGVGFLFERSVTRWTFTAAADVVFPGQPDGWEEAGVDVRELYSLQAGVELRATDRLSWLAQVFWTSPITRDFDSEEFSREILDLALGFAVDTGGPRVYGGFQEDLVAATGPDFGVFLGVSWGF